MIAVILDNQYDYAAVLSLSGKDISASSSTNDMRKAYLVLSRKCHPDKHQGNPDAKRAFQALVTAFDLLSQPELSNEDGTKKKGRAKQTVTERPNDAECYATRINCPRCHMEWRKPELGLEDVAYNFFMMGIKQYICGRCACQFGCMAAEHLCPHCNQPFEYHPNDYHRKISCGNESGRCSKNPKVFGFWYFKLSQRRFDQVRIEVKEEQERRNKQAAALGRRQKRSEKRIENKPEVKVDPEWLFVNGLVDECPRCGFVLPPPFKSELAQEHLAGCTCKETHARYQKNKEVAKRKAAAKASMEAKEGDVMMEKQWEMNGRQIGQLWMLSDAILRRQCVEFSLGTADSLLGVSKPELIVILSKHLRSISTLMIKNVSHSESLTMKDVEYDDAGIADVDANDLPSNLYSMEKEELMAVCASYGIPFQSTDTKMTLISRLEKSRHKGSQLLLEDETLKKEKKSGGDDEDFVLDEDDAPLIPKKRKRE
jgi:hypothetical protein